MNLINKAKLALSFVLIAFVVVSCSDDDTDTAKPTINLVAPVDHTVLHIGGDVHFDCEFADDVELRSYKIDIHNNFDGHTHEHSVLKSSQEGEGHPWSFNQTWEFEAGIKNADVHHHEIKIPETIVVDGVEEPVAEGEYHLGVYCLDAAGNESKFFVEVMIEHGEDNHGH